MEHSFLDKYSEMGSFIHRLDPRTKLIFSFLYILFVISTPPMEFFKFAGYLAIILIVIFISRVPPGYVLKRSLIIIPFVLLVALFIPFTKDPSGNTYNLGFLHISRRGLWIFWNALIKSWLSVLSLIVLSSTTKFHVLLKGLEHLKIPGILIMLLSFMYRYVFVLIDEVMRMERARKSRHFGGKYLRQIKTIGNLLGSLFIRTYEKGERIYQCMVARGFKGEVKILTGLKLLRKDFLFLTILLGCLSIIKWGML